MKKINILYLLGFIVLLLFLFRNWILSAQIIGGDWPYFYKENIREFGFLPPVWSSVQGGGFGGPLLVYPLDSYLYVTGWFFSNVLHIPWDIVYKLVWFGMFLFLSGFSVYKLFKQIAPKISLKYVLIGALMYLSNTYSLLVVGGGQMGVALGYAIAPLVLMQFIKLINSISLSSRPIQFSLIAGLLFAVQVLFDIRIAYITMLAVIVYILFEFISQRREHKIHNLIKTFVYALVIPLFTTIVLHAYWLLPFLFIGQGSISQLGSGYTSADAVTFFSFATFENALGLLHPNWPENIFGKISFMKPEFLVLPLIAFSSLLFSKSKQKKNINVAINTNDVLVFALLGLLGVFFAKGANDPFGNVYLWLFDFIPGFVMFRDPTKWYLLIALSYSILIPFTLDQFTEKFLTFKKAAKYKHIWHHSFLLLMVLYLLFLIRPAILGNLSGTFAHHTVPSEYEQLKDKLLNDKEFSRTMWFPRMQRFGFSNQNHPAIEATVIFNATNSADLIRQIKKKDAEKRLADLSIEYVIVPYDSEKEIFLKDRKYNAKERNFIVEELDSLPWLQKQEQFSHIAIYQMKNHKDHIWLLQNGKLSYTKKSLTEYKVQVSTTTKNKLIFNERYSPYWILHVGGEKIKSESYKGMNSFDLPKLQNEVTLTYSLNKLYEIGRIISFVTVVLLLVLLGMVKKQKTK